MYFEKSKSKLEADNAAIYFFRTLPKAVRNQWMPPTNTDYSVSFRSNLMCGTVVVIDGITAWRVYKKFCLFVINTSGRFGLLHHHHATQLSWWSSGVCTLHFSGGPTPLLHSYRVQCASNSSIVRKSRPTHLWHIDYYLAYLCAHTLCKDKMPGYKNQLDIT